LFSLALDGFLSLALFFSFGLARDFDGVRVGLLGFRFRFGYGLGRWRYGLRDGRRRRFGRGGRRWWRWRRLSDHRLRRRRIELRRHRRGLPVLPPDRKEEYANESEVDGDREHQRGPTARDLCRRARSFAYHRSHRRWTREQANFSHAVTLQEIEHAQHVFVARRLIGSDHDGLIRKLRLLRA